MGSFQSPSLRGSGRFAATPRGARRGSDSFNPLHCGAVVASPPRLPQAGGVSEKFQSPSLRGSGRFAPVPIDDDDIPFCFNPLHCGAVVASSASRRARSSASARFNPLHCGAVVASKRPVPAGHSLVPVSIPFIAGQWSLPIRIGRGRPRPPVFQSPSLRGSGRFADRFTAFGDLPDEFQSPSLRGSGRFTRSPRSQCRTICAAFQSPSLRGSGRFGIHNANNVGVGVVSIPFIAGQWSLQHETILPGGRYLLFQSPSLRGSGRFYRS